MLDPEVQEHAVVLVDLERVEIGGYGGLRIPLPRIYLADIVVGCHEVRVEVDCAAVFVDRLVKVALVGELKGAVVNDDCISRH